MLTHKQAASQIRASVAEYRSRRAEEYHEDPSPFETKTEAQRALQDEVVELRRVATLVSAGKMYEALQTANALPKTGRKLIAEEVWEHMRDFADIEPNKYDLSRSHLV